jgi:hypothetical protein
MTAYENAEAACNTSAGSTLCPAKAVSILMQFWGMSGVGCAAGVFQGDGDVGGEKNAVIVVSGWWRLKRDGELACSIGDCVDVLCDRDCCAGDRLDLGG